MSLRIFLTGDLHIGLRFTRYPEKLRARLAEARVQVLVRMVEQANTKKAQLFVIAGDLFDHHNVAMKTIQRVQKALEAFDGALVIVLPGNHDFQDGTQNIWSLMKGQSATRILVADQAEPLNLEHFGLSGVVYPCPCDRKHSAENNVGWIRNLAVRPEGTWHIGIAHGALQHLSPDLEKQYFNMSESELKACGLDLWLLGHTHIPYPVGDSVRDERIFNAGTPEPDGMDCRHGGSAWLINMDETKQITAERIPTGQYFFREESVSLTNCQDIAAMEKKYTGLGAESTLLRLNIVGSLEQQERPPLHDTLDRIDEQVLHLEYDSSNLRTRVTPGLIDKEFSAGSFPHRFLTNLHQQGAQQALQIAYELVREVKKS